MALQNFHLMRYLGTCLKWLIGGRWRTEGGDLRQDVSVVSVYLNDTGNLGDGPHAKPKNFHPRPNKALSGRMELSSYCLEGLVLESRKWNLLQASSKVRPVIGRSEVDTSVVAALITVDPDWKPARHVNFHGWPTVETEKQ